jgi:hypothetical protein
VSYRDNKEVEQGNLFEGQFARSKESVRLRLLMRPTFSGSEDLRAYRTMDGPCLRHLVPLSKQHISHLFQLDDCYQLAHSCVRQVYKLALTICESGGDRHRTVPCYHCTTPY